MNERAYEVLYSAIVLKKKNVWCSQMCNTKCRANFYFILVHVKFKK